MTLRKVLIIAFGFHFMINITRPLISLFAAKLGADSFDIGALIAAYAFFPLIFAIHAGKFADRIGDKLPLVMGTIGAGAGLALPFCFPAMWALYLSQVIVGVAHLFINLSLQNVLGNAATKENRDHYYSMLSMMVALGVFIGPIAGGHAAEFFSYSSAFLVSVVVGIVPMVFSFFLPVFRHEKDAETQAVSSSLTLLKIPLLRKALVSSALVLYSRDIFVAYFPLFAKQLGFSDSMIGWIIAVQGLSMVAVRLFLGRLTLRYGRNRILLASILIAGISFLLVPFAGQLFLFMILSAFMGIGLGCGQPLSMTTTYNASPKTRTGEVLGLRLATNRLSQLIAPLFFGLIGSTAGLLSVFYVSGAFLIGGALLTKSADEE